MNDDLQSCSKSPNSFSLRRDSTAGDLDSSLCAVIIAAVVCLFCIQDYGQASLCSRKTAHSLFKIRRFEFTLAGAFRKKVVENAQTITGHADETRIIVPRYFEPLRVWKRALD
jgi:hypothetical protein